MKSPYNAVDRDVDSKPGLVARFPLSADELSRVRTLFAACSPDAREEIRCFLLQKYSLARAVVA